MNLWWVNRSVPVIHTVRRMLGPVVFLPKKRELPPFLFSQTLREALETRVKSHKKKKKPVSLCKENNCIQGSLASVSQPRASRLHLRPKPG